MSKDGIEKIKQYEAWSKSADSASRATGLINLAGTYHYGWHDTPKDFGKAAHYYNLLLSEPEGETRAKSLERFASLLHNPDSLRALGGKKFVEMCEALMAAAEGTTLAYRPARAASLALTGSGVYRSDISAQPNRARKAFDVAIASASSDAERGDVLYWLAECYYRGIGGFPKDRSRALELHREVLTLDDPSSEPFSAYRVGCLLLGRDEGIKMDLPGAADCFTVAINSKNYLSDSNRDEIVASALFNLAWIYSAGKGGVKYDYDKALEYANRAIEAGSEKAKKLKEILVNNKIAGDEQVDEMRLKLIEQLIGFLLG